MSRTIAQRELRNDNAKIIDAVAAGESFVVTRNGVAIAELRPITTPRQRVVAKASILDAAARAPRIDAARFRADLDAAVDQTVGP